MSPRAGWSSAPGRCGSASVVFVCLMVLLGLLLWDGRAQADPKEAKKPAAEAKPTQGGASASKMKSYTFGGLDIDGKLKTPQLLYFLNRMKSEFDTTTPDKRSFIPELKRSPEEM
jgi:hypothetical protein